MGRTTVNHNPPAKVEAERIRALAGHKRRAPWTDFTGKPIYEGDVIEHPSGERGTVVLLTDYCDPNDQWRVAYEGSPGLSRLCLQIGWKGQAVVKSLYPPAETGA